MKFVAEEYGAQLHTAVLHTSMKSFPTSILRNPKGLRNVECVPGDKASKETNSKLEAKKAMQAYQDAYYEGVRPLRAHTIRPASPTTDAGQWKAQKAHAERVASAESAVLDAATQREKDAAMQAKANAQAAELLAKEA